MDLLEIEPLDLGPDLRAIGIELVEADENREPVRGPDAARVWGRVLGALPGGEPWVLDFFSHVDRVREYCTRHHIEFREGSSRSLAIPGPGAEALKSLLNRFERETFGARCGGPLPAEDRDLETELARRGVDAYHKSYSKYLFCGVCNFEDGSLVVLSEKLWASEVIRRVRPVLKDLEVEVRLPPQ